MKAPRQSGAQQRAAGGPIIAGAGGCCDDRERNTACTDKRLGLTCATRQREVSRSAWRAQARVLDVSGWDEL